MWLPISPSWIKLNFVSYTTIKIIDCFYLQLHTVPQSNTVNPLLKNAWSKREHKSFLHVLYVQPKVGNLLHFSHPVTNFDVERQPAKEFLNGFLSQWESVMPKCFPGMVKTAENRAELYSRCIDYISEC